ncbi:hypothetical protein [Methylibium rhizosphaerae]|uniref:hypothetical protein n=1 Tax=Methylibium rhizosphaerae TaxID=2570323 RepID=UPI0011292FE1|nr:hypothetical protein [Methylibium rhizosphaerae]
MKSTQAISFDGASLRALPRAVALVAALLAAPAGAAENAPKVPEVIVPAPQAQPAHKGAAVQTPPPKRTKGKAAEQGAEGAKKCEVQLGGLDDASKGRVGPRPRCDELATMPIQPKGIKQ